jgi:putative peptidoglycan lipid II flippase
VTTRSRTLARAGLIVTTAFMLSRVLGWLRLVVIGGTFGAAGELDTFFAAFRIPDLIFQLVAAGALGSALIPIVAGLLASGERARAWRVVSTVTNLMLVAFAVLAVVLAVLAPQLIEWMTPGFSPAQVERTVGLTRLMLASPVLLALGAVATSVLNAEGRFAAAALAPVLYNLAIIGGAVILAPSMGVTGLAVGVVAGSALNLLIQLPPIARLGFRYRPALDVADPSARRALTLMLPRAIGMGASQITFVVATTLASGLGAGAISAFNFAFTLLQIPIGVIGVPLGTVVFPSMARDLATGAVGDFLALVTRSVRLLLFVMLPITGVAIVLRTQLVTLLFGYGRFDQAAIALTADTLLCFMLGLAAHSVIAVLARAFYAGQDTRTPVAAAILAVAINSSLAFVLVGPMGLSGLALAIAIAAWIEAIVLFVILDRRHAELDLVPVLRMTVAATLASVAAAAVTLGVNSGLVAILGGDPARPVLLLQAGLAAAAGGLAYLALAAALRIRELPTIVAVMTDLLRRRARS